MAINFLNNPKVGDNVKIEIGTGSDLQIYHDGSNSFITNSTGDLTISNTGDDLILKSADDFLLYVQGSELAIQAVGNAGVILRHNNVVKFETTNAGVEVFGNVDLDSSTNLRLRFYNGTAFKAGIESVRAAGNMISGSAIDDLAIRSQSNMLFSAGGSVEMMRIDTAGNLAIGTTSATSKLTISDNSYQVMLIDTSTSNRGEISVEDAAFGFYADRAAATADSSFFWSIDDVNKMEINLTAGGEGQLRLNDYGPGNITGTVEFILGVDANGNVIETSAGGSGTVTGTGAATRVAFWSSTTALSSDANLYWDNTNDRLGIGTTAPEQMLEVNSSAHPTIVVSSATDDCSIAFKKGTGATPTWRVGRDHSAADNLTFAYSATGYPSLTGSSLISIDTSGNVGIGTTTPDYELDVAGEIGLDSYLRHNGDTDTFFGFSGNNEIKFRTSGSDRIFINSSGNVGIGTTSPSTKLHVVGNINIQGTGGYLRWNNGDMAIVNAGSYAMAFQTYTGSALTEKMRIDSAGNVGIGITPYSHGTGILGVDLGGSTASIVGGRSRTRITSNLYYNGTNNIYKEGYGGLGYYQDAVNISHAWYTAPTGTAGGTATTVERMRIDSDGKVGIGMTAPNAKLHVDAPTITANSLTYGAGAGQIFTNENSEFAFGLLNVSPYPLYIQGRHITNTARNISLNVLGGNIGIGTYSPSAKAVISNGGALGYEIDPASASGEVLSLFSYNRSTSAWKTTRYSALDHRFETNGTTERMRIDSAGNVGIGLTPASTVLLDLKESDSSADLIIGLTAGTGARAQIRSDAQADNTTSELSFYTTASSSTLERMRIGSDGFVRIGSATASNAYTPAQGYVVGISSPVTNTQTYLSITTGGGSLGNTGIIFGIDSGGGSWYHREDKPLRLYTNGNERMRVNGNGNVGIGTTSPSALLEVAGSALLQKSFYQTMPNSGGQANKGGYIARPKGGDFISSVNTQTGSLEIQLPTGGNSRDDMVKFVIDIYEYSTNRSLTVFVGGYIYQGIGGTTWLNCSAQIIGSTAADNYTVRFGDNDNVHCVWIGETNEIWTYPQVIVRDFYGGYVTNITEYLGDWDIDFVSEQTNVAITLTNNFPLSSGGTSGAFLPLAGGTLTGDLTISNASPALILKDTGGTTPTDTIGYISMREADGTEVAFVGMGSGSNNGLYLYGGTGTDVIISTNATPAIVIDTSQNVGIGTTSPAHLLTLNESTNNTSLAFYNDSTDTSNRNWTIGSNDQVFGDFSIITSVARGGNPTSNTTGVRRLYINPSGNVGIGTTAPIGKMEISTSNVRADANGGADELVLQNNGYCGISIFSNSSNAGQILFGDSGASVAGLLQYWHSDNSMRFGTNTTEKMRITSAGNVGIGTTSPVANANRNTLALQGAWGGQLDIMVGSAVHAQFGTDNFSSGLKARIQSGDGIVFKVNGDTSLAEAMRIDSAGNVGIGVVPKTGGITWQHIQFGGTGNLIARKTDSTVDAMFANNYYVNSSGADSHITTGLATRMFLNDGEIRFDTAPSAAADAAAVFTNRLFIANTGNVGIGTTLPNAPLHIQKDSNASDVMVNLKNTKYGSTNTSGETKILFGWLNHEAANIAAYKDGTVNRTGFKFVGEVGYNTPSELMRITSAGKLGIGITSPQAPLSFANATGNKIDFYSANNDRYGIQVEPSELRIHSGAGGQSTGGITFGKDDGTTFTEAMRVRNDGNVGIGITSPLNKLSVGLTSGVSLANQPAVPLFVSNNGQSVDGRVFIDVKHNSINGASALGAGLRMQAGAVTTGTASFNSSLIFLEAAAPGSNTIHSAPKAIRFYVDNHDTDAGSGTSYTQFGDLAMTIAENTNVGIGATSPGAKLEVVGDSRIYDSLNVGYRTSSTSTTNYEPRLILSGKNNYSDGTTWYGNYGQLLLTCDANMTSSARRFLITNALDNNKFAIVRSASATSNPVVNSTAAGVNNGTADFVINNAGSVGIGTTGPVSKFHVQGQDVTFYSGTAYQSLQVGRSAAERLELFVNDNDVKLTGIQDADNNGVHNFIIDRSFGGTGASNFQIQNGGANQLTILNSGNVGIGTTSPDTVLELEGAAPLLKLSSDTANGSPYLQFAQTGTRRSFIQHNNSGDNLFLASEYGGIKFFTGTGGTETEKMVIQADGTVGIGVTNPVNKLQVTGKIYSSTDIQANSQLRGGSLRLPEGGNSSDLSEPALFIDINVDGTVYVIPCYNRD